MERLLRKSVMVLMALALALGAWGRLPVQPVAAATCTWTGNAGDGLWASSNNWAGCTGGGVPASTDEVVLDNSTVANDYTVTLPTGNVKVTINKLTITPNEGKTITLVLPSGNTYGASNDAGFVVGDAASSTDDIILNNGAILKNSSGATTGNGIQVNTPTNGTIRINNGGKYIHNTLRSTNGIVPALSTASGTETGIFEQDSPGTGSVAIAASGRNYGTLILTRSAGAATYTATGGSQLTVRGDFIINSGVTFNSTMTANMLVAGNWTHNGTAFSHASTVIFNGTAEQTIGGSSATTFNNLTINAGATVVVPTTVAVNGTLTNNGALKQTREVNAATVSFLNISTGKYYGVDITTTGNMGDTTVTVWGNQACAGTQNTVLRCFDISPTTPQGAEITLYYRDAEENGQTAPNIWHFSGGNWVKATDITRGGSGEGKWVRGTVTAFSPFTLSNNNPLAVDLTDFSAVWDGDAVTVSWETAQELDNLGFNLYRGESAAGPWTRLNAELIPTQNPGAVFGATYTWLDENVTPGATYFYRLEDVDIYGVSTFHGPVSTAPVDPSAVALSAFGARGPAFGLPLALAALGLWGLARKRRS